jgi:DNA repair exonuclease SbcCD ATPase subunit/DNA repair exonuclease SbcCD nuclease subunit
LKFAHIADTHIKNLKFHYEYKVVFEQLYEQLKEKNVDYIIHCGDIAHTKTQISPEFVEMCTDFFRNLADIAPTYVILGNHDGNLKNSSRQDALTPIADALEHPNLHLLKDSGEVVLNDNFALNVLSVFDEDNWSDPTNYERVNIALYHGSISGCKTDIGWTMEYGENDISIFDNFDYAFLGDIHKTNQVLDEAGRIRYAGSTIQQNHGETNDKGYLVWDVKDKKTFTVEHHVLLNPKPFVTIELTPKGRIPKGTNIQEGARLRLVANNNLPLASLRKAIDVAKSRFKPESITFLNRSAGERGSVDEITDGLVKENLREISVQEEFIDEYLKDYEADSEVLEKVYDLNRKYNTLAEEDEEVSRNINWRINKFTWDNLFNYGEKNCINFEKLSGVVGIFGKNYSGKSSIIDGMLYTLFNSTSKNERKNLNIINQNKETCVGNLEISIGNDLYTIERNSEKYTKRLKGEETLEAKTNVEFNSCNAVTGDVTSHNGLTRSGTDKSIRKFLGTVDDFLLTSMASQLGSLSFINEGSTRRKEILAKFLDLEIFEKKFKMAKEDNIDLRGALKRLEGKEFDEDIEIAEANLTGNETRTREQKRECEKYKEKISSTNEELAELVEMINSIPADVIDIFDVKNHKSVKESEVALLDSENERIKDDCDEKRSLYEKIDKFLDSFDIEELQYKKELIGAKASKLNEIVGILNIKERDHEVKEKKVGLLSEVPCGEEYSHCKFIHDAYVAKEEVPKLKKSLKVLNNEKESLENSITTLDPDRVDEHFEKYEKVLGKKNDLANDITQNELKLEKNLSKRLSLQHEIESLQEKIDEYEENKDVIENLENLLKSKKAKSNDLISLEESLQTCEDQILELYKEHGSLQQLLDNLTDQKEELEQLREEYTAYDLFLRCMHSNGISYDIIKRKLPAINDEVSKVLANVVDFEVFFEDDGKKLDIFIKHPKYDPRPIEMGSGAEKTIAAMAIRLALLSVSNLPKSNVFILDEPATALDAENMDGFVRILDMVKSYYPIILLVSHVDSLKDIVDMTIDIEHRDGFAYVNQ